MKEDLHADSVTAATAAKGISLYNRTDAEPQTENKLTAAGTPKKAQTSRKRAQTHRTTAKHTKARIRANSKPHRAMKQNRH